MDLLTKIWILIDVAVCVVAFISYALRNNYPLPLLDVLKDLATWGKTREDRNDKKRTLDGLKSLFLVPKRWFTHFYACGLLWNIYLLVSFLHICLQEDPSFHGVFNLVPIINGEDKSSHDAIKLDCFTVLLMLMLITVQLTRRLYESLFISSYSGKMHVIHYLVGLIFYGMVNLSIIAEVPTTLNTGWCSSCLQPSFKNIQLYHVLAISLFTWANYHQYQCHLILAKLTAFTSGGKKVYKIPYGDWFEYVSSPHYFAEIIIYIALFFIMQGISHRSLFLVLFVVSNLSLGATITHEWYQKKFESYPKTRNRIVPYIF